MLRIIDGISDGLLLEGVFEDFKDREVDGKSKDFFDSKLDRPSDR